MTNLFHELEQLLNTLTERPEFIPRLKIVGLLQGNQS